MPPLCYCESAPSYRPAPTLSFFFVFVFLFFKNIPYKNIEAEISEFLRMLRICLRLRI